MYKEKSVTAWTIDIMKAMSCRNFLMRMCVQSCIQYIWVWKKILNQYDVCTVLNLSNSDYANWKMLSFLSNIVYIFITHWKKFLTFIKVARNLMEHSTNLPPFPVSEFYAITKAFSGYLGALSVNYNTYNGRQYDVFWLLRRLIVTNQACLARACFYLSESAHFRPTKRKGALKAQFKAFQYVISRYG